MSRGLRKAAVAIGVVAGVSLAAAAATGIWLAENYRPGAWVEVAPDRFRIEAGGGWIHELHVWAAIVLGASAVALVLVTLTALVRRAAGAATGRSALASVGLAVAVVMGFVSARDLRWNQLALWAVTVGSDVKGIWGTAFDDSVRFFLVDGKGEVSPDEYRSWAVAHLVAVPCLVLVAGLLVAVTVLRATTRNEGEGADRTGGRSAPR